MTMFRPSSSFRFSSLPLHPRVAHPLRHPLSVFYAIGQPTSLITPSSSFRFLRRVEYLYSGKQAHPSFLFPFLQVRVELPVILFPFLIPAQLKKAAIFRHLLSVSHLYCLFGLASSNQSPSRQPLSVSLTFFISILCSSVIFFPFRCCALPAHQRR